MDKREVIEIGKFLLMYGFALYFFRHILQTFGFEYAAISIGAGLLVIGRYMLKALGELNARYRNSE